MLLNGKSILTEDDKLTAGDGISISNGVISGNLYTGLGANTDGSVTQQAITDAVNIKTFLSGRNREEVGNKFSTLTDFYNYFCQDLNKTYIGSLGAQESSNLKTLLGNPSGFSNYTSCEITCDYYCPYGTEGKAGAVFKCYAFGYFINKLAVGYIFRAAHATTSNVVTWSGWAVLK